MNLYLVIKGNTFSLFFIYNGFGGPRLFKLSLSFKILSVHCGVVKNISRLSLQEHKICFCCFSINLTILGNVHTLNLNWCKNIKDVSALGNVHTLRK